MRSGTADLQRVPVVVSTLGKDVGGENLEQVAVLQIVRYPRAGALAETGNMRRQRGRGTFRW